MSRAPVNSQKLGENESWICPGKYNRTCDNKEGVYRGDVATCTWPCPVLKDQVLKCYHCRGYNLEGSEICLTTYLEGIDLPCTEIQDWDNVPDTEDDPTAVDMNISAAREDPAADDAESSVTPGPSGSTEGDTNGWYCFNCATGQERDLKLQYNTPAATTCHYCNTSRHNNSLEIVLCRNNKTQGHWKMNPASATHCIDPNCQEPLPNAWGVGDPMRTYLPRSMLDLVLPGPPREGSKWRCTVCGKPPRNKKSDCQWKDGEERFCPGLRRDGIRVLSF
jgi:hypothetical protein